MSGRAVCPVTNDLCIKGCFPAGCRRHIVPATRARAHLADPVALALEAMTPEQFGQSMDRWVEHGRPLSGETLAYIDAIYREIAA